MARVPYVKAEDLPQEYGNLYEELEKQRGTPPLNLHKAMANSPGLLARFWDMANELRNRTVLDARLRELAIITVGVTTGAEYEVTHHWNLALRAGVSREKLEHLADFETAPVFNERERAVMRYAAAATGDVNVSDAVFDPLKSFLSTRELVELVMNVGFYNLVVRVLLPLRIDLDHGARKS